VLIAESCPQSVAVIKAKYQSVELQAVRKTPYRPTIVCWHVRRRSRDARPHVLGALLGARLVTGCRRRPLCRGVILQVSGTRWRHSDARTIVGDAAKTAIRTWRDSISGE